MSSTASGPGNSSRYLDFDEYVDLKLQKTRATIKTTDILVALAGMAAMFLGYLLVFVIFDQWVVPGGFSIGLRWVLLSTLLLLTCAWLGWKVGRPYLRSVNRLFAANEIEKADGNLKSNLLNLIDLRAAGRPVDPAILRALEKNAAVGLQKVDVSQAVDHRPLMRIAYVLLAVVVAFCLYALFSPKKISNSIWRSLLPAAKLSVATQTEIVRVEPGDITIPARTDVTFSADIAGDVPDKIWVLYSTRDGKFRDEPIELRGDSAAATRFIGVLPTVVQDLTYVVRAGDAVSREYHITVTQPPSATVDRVRYQFPTYMKLEETEQAGGQIDSWDGTKVSLTAHTNIPIKSATIQFLDTVETGPNGEEVSVFVSPDGHQLTAKWNLGFRSDGAYARLYQIQCKTESGAIDPKPIQYAITIRPDLAPEVALLEPVRDMDVPANTVVPLLIEARDPDFQLSQVNLHVKKNGQQVHKEMLLNTLQQRLLTKHDLKLERLQVKPGDTVELWVQAFDNRLPRPNSKTTPELKLKIVEAISEKDAQQKLADDQANRDQRLKEAEQDQNPDGQPEPKPVTGDASDKERRDPPDPMRREQQAKPPEEGEKGADDGNAGEKPSPDQTGAGDKTKNSPNGRGDKGKGAEQKNRDKGQGEQADDKSTQSPLNTTGEDDDKALEKLIEGLKKENEKQTSQRQEQKRQDGEGGEQPKERKPEGSSEEGDSPKNETSPSPNTAAEQLGKPNQESKPDKKGGDKTQQRDSKQPPKEEPSKQNPTKPAETDANKNSSQGNRPKPNETEPKQPMPGASETKQPDQQGAKGNDSPQPNANKSDKNAAGGDKQKAPNEKGPMEQGGEPKPNEGATPKKGEGAGAGDTPKADKMTEGQDVADPAGPEPKPAPKKGDQGTGADAAGPGGAEKPEPAPGPMSGGEEAKDKGTGAEKAAKSSPDAQAGGDTATPMPAKGNGPAEEKDGTSAEGPEEAAPPSPNAQKKKADGSEEGIAQPDRDPGAKPTKSDNPNLKRDPNEKPETQSREATDQESNDAAKQAADNKVKVPKPQPGGAEKQKTEQTGESEKTPPGKNEQKRQGDPNAPNEQQKGTGKKEQRSKTGDGGQGGTSKEDQEGDPGSQSSGQGDATSRPGAQQPANEKSKQMGGENKAGAGKDSSAGGEKKPGPKGSQEGSSKDAASDKAGQDASAKPGAEGGGQEGAQGGEGPAGGQPGGKGEGGAPGSASPAGTGGNPGKGGEGRPGNGGNAPGKGRPDPNRDATEANSSGSTPEGEEANLEYKRQATELVLKRLQDELERGDVDPELLDKLGWTKEELRRFSERMNKALQESKAGDETPESLSRRQQFEEMLKSLDVNKSGTKRSGQDAPQREVNQIESRHSTVPKGYRDASEKLSREINRQKKAASQK